MTRYNQLGVEFDVIMTKIEDGCVLHANYFDKIDQIIEILETGRANTLSEALNLFINDERAFEMKAEMKAIRRKLSSVESATKNISNDSTSISNFI